MDNIPNVPMETPTPIPTPQPATKPKHKSNGGLVALCICLGLIVVGLLVYIAYEKDYIQIPFLSKNDSANDTSENSDSSSNGATETKKETPSTTNTFTGTTVTATLPTGWTMKEYYNGQGSEYLSDGPVYKGLTGIKIFNASNTSMFYLAGVNGIGFAGCSEYYAFADDNPAFRAESQSAADEMGDPMHVNDFSSTPYVEYEVLGRTVRRIASKIYLDSTEGNNYFEAPCFNVVVTFEGLSYTDETNQKYEAYFYGFNTTITNDELLKVDDILKSMKVVE